MFVVRTTNIDNEVKFKAFEKLADARAYYDAVAVMTYDGEANAVALFEADTDNVREAVGIIKSADKSRARFLDAAPRKLKLDLSGLEDWKPNADRT